MSIVCALSNEVPEVPVVSQVSGYIFDRQLIEKYIKEHGTDPTNGKQLTVQQLTNLKFPTEKSPGFAVSAIRKSPTKSPSSAHNDSSLTVDQVNLIVGVNYYKLLGERKRTAEEVLEHIERAPSNVLDKVFETLARSERTHQYPNEETLVITRSAMFHPILEIVVDELMRQFNLTSSNDIEIEGEVKISLPQSGKDVRGRIDYTANKPTFTTELTFTTEVECDADSGVASEVKSEDRVFLHIECKKCNPVHGYKQSLLFLKDARDKHPDREEIYAISTTFEDWMLVKSSGKGQFSATRKFEMLFGDMGNRANEEANKNNWLKNYSKIVDVIWTILKNELQNSPRRMLAQTEQPTGKEQSSGSNTRSCKSGRKQSNKRKKIK